MQKKNNVVKRTNDGKANVQRNLGHAEILCAQMERKKKHYCNEIITESELIGKLSFPSILPSRGNCSQH